MENTLKEFTRKFNILSDKVKEYISWKTILRQVKQQDNKKDEVVIQNIENRIKSLEDYFLTINIPPFQ